MLVWTVPSVHCSRPLPCTGTCSRGESCRKVTAFCRCASPWGRALRERPPYRREDREDHQHPDEVDGEQRREGYQEPPHFRAEDPRPCMSARHRNARVTLTAAAHTCTAWPSQASGRGGAPPCRPAPGRSTPTCTRHQSHSSGLQTRRTGNAARFNN